MQPVVTHPPQLPIPERYGLTPERIRRLRVPGAEEQWYSGWLFVAGGLSWFIAYAVTNSGDLAFMVGLAVAIFGGVVCNLGERIWRSTQPDYSRFQEYECAYAEQRRLFAEWNRTQMEWWRTLGPRQFELELAALLRRRGCNVQWTGRPGDGGVDLRVTDQRGVIIIQCKAHKKPIGPGAVRDLFGALHHNGCREAWMVSLAGFTDAAREFARDKPVRLLTIAELLQ